MNPEYPYQLVYFLDKQPVIGETVYSGTNGWYPQLALKRRFRFHGMDEETGLHYVAEFCRQWESELSFRTRGLTADDRMPVKYIEVDDGDDRLGWLHRRFIAFMDTRIRSKYPEREGDSYMPHITAEYGGKMVIDVDMFANKEFHIKEVCLLKDVEGENSIAYRYFTFS